MKIIMMLLLFALSIYSKECDPQLKCFVGVSHDHASKEFSKEAGCFPDLDFEEYGDVADGCVRILETVLKDLPIPKDGDRWSLPNLMDFVLQYGGGVDDDGNECDGIVIPLSRECIQKSTLLENVEFNLQGYIGWDVTSVKSFVDFDLHGKFVYWTTKMVGGDVRLFEQLFGSEGIGGQFIQELEAMVSKVPDLNGIQHTFKGAYDFIIPQVPLGQIYTGLKLNVHALANDWADGLDGDLVVNEEIMFEKICVAKSDWAPYLKYLQPWPAEYIPWNNLANGVYAVTGREATNVLCIGSIVERTYVDEEYLITKRTTPVVWQVTNLPVTVGAIEIKESGSNLIMEGGTFQVGQELEFQSLINDIEGNSYGVTWTLERDGEEIDDDYYSSSDPRLYYLLHKYKYEFVTEGTYTVKICVSEKGLEDVCTEKEIEVLTGTFVEEMNEVDPLPEVLDEQLSSEESTEPVERTPPDQKYITINQIWESDFPQTGITGTHLIEGLVSDYGFPNSQIKSRDWIWEKPSGEIELVPYINSKQPFELTSTGTHNIKLCVSNIFDHYVCNNKEIVVDYDIQVSPYRCLEYTVLGGLLPGYPEKVPLIGNVRVQTGSDDGCGSSIIDDLLCQKNYSVNSDVLSSKFTNSFNGEGNTIVIENQKNNNLGSIVIGECGGMYAMHSKYSYKEWGEGGTPQVSEAVVTLETRRIQLNGTNLEIGSKSTRLLDYLPIYSPVASENIVFDRWKGTHFEGMIRPHQNIASTRLLKFNTPGRFQYEISLRDKAFNRGGHDWLLEGEVIANLPGIKLLESRVENNSSTATFEITLLLPHTLPLNDAWIQFSDDTRIPLGFFVTNKNIVRNEKSNLAKFSLDHYYNTSGNYSAKVCTKDYLLTQICKDIFIKSSNTSPLEVTMPEHNKEFLTTGTAIEFNVSKISDENITHIGFEFGDGTFENIDLSTIEDLDHVLSHKYNESGKYNVTVTTYFEDGRKSHQIMEIEIKDEPLTHLYSQILGMYGTTMNNSIMNQVIMPSVTIQPHIMQNVILPMP